MFWTLLVSTALAAPDSGDGSLVDRLADSLPETGDVLLAAAGPDAHGAAVTALTSSKLDAARVSLVEIPATGDLPALALAEAERLGVACAALLSADPAGVWTTEILGSCPAAPTAEDPASADASAAAPALNVTPAEWGQREQRFNEERLEVGEATGKDLTEAVSWSVLDGQGTSLDASDLATIAGDEDMLLGLMSESRQASRQARWLRWSGIATLVASPLPLLGLESSALEQNQDRIFTSVFIAGVGSALIAVAPSARRGVVARQRHPANYYREEDAEDVVVAHNKALFAELQLADKPELPAGSVEAQAPPSDAAQPTPSAVDAPTPSDEATEAPSSGDPPPAPDPRPDAAADPAPANAAAAAATEPPDAPKDQQASGSSPEETATTDDPAAAGAGGEPSQD